jgi:MFS family permease
LSEHQPRRPSSAWFLPRAGLRRDLWVTTADAAAFSLMVGCGETYIPAFALAVGLGPVAAGMTASVPVLVGAIFQLITPLAVARLGTNRGWCIACTMVQAFSFVPFAWWAIRGHATLVELLLAASVYWSAGMAGAPAWNTWMGTLIPQGMRTAYFANRNRLGQFGVFIGFVLGGLILQWGEASGVTLLAFAGLFLSAGVCRLVSTMMLVSCREFARPPTTVPSDAPAASVNGTAFTRWLHDTIHALRRMANSPSGPLVAYLCCLVFAAQFSAPYFTPYMLRERGFSYHAFMLVVATSFLAKALFLPSLGRLGSRIGSLGLLWAGGLSVIPLTLLWLPSANVAYLAGVQVLAGCCWACWELAVALLFFDAVPHRDRTGVITVYNLGLAIATVAGAAAGGMLLRALGEDSRAYIMVFAVSSLLRLATVPLLRRVRMPEQSTARRTDDQLEGNLDSLAMLSRNERARP